jgi:hypothetical protein
MRSTRRAAAAAVSISLALTGVTAAHAESSTLLYVNGSSPTCTDSGSGTADTPYCTIQAAADAAVAGDTVDIADGRYVGDVDIKSVGTAVAPIVFQAVGTNIRLLPAPGQTAPALTFDGASYVTFQGRVNSNGWQNTMVDGALVRGSDHITLNELEFIASTEVAGTSSSVTISRSWARGKGVTVDAGSSGDVISTNFMEGSTISVADVADTAITSNTLMAAGTQADAVSVSGASTGVTVENNIAAYPGGGTGTGAEIAVAADAAAGTTVDYNVVWPDPQDYPTVAQAAYSWAGADYSSPAALYRATGQGKHDLEADPSLNPAPYGDVSAAPQNNSANSAAPGMLETDMAGRSCTGDPIVAVTGAGTPAYCARGAVQPDYTTTVAATATAVTALSVSLNSTLSQTMDIGGIQSGAYVGATPAVSYTINWGNGTTKTYNGSNTATYTYPKPGTYTITDTADFTNGTAAVTTTSFTTTGSGYTADGPTRILDTRKGLGAAKAKVGAGSFIKLKIAAIGSIPANVKAVALNLTVTDATGGGNIDAVPDGTGITGSNVNYSSGQTVANGVIVGVASDGYIDLYNSGSSGSSVDLIVDVSGYFTTTSSASGYTAVTEKRLLDTRAGTGAAKAKIAAGSAVAVTIAGTDSIPSGITAVAVHVTVTNSVGGGWIAAEAYGAGTPTTSSLNFGKGQTISNTVIVPVAANGKIELYNGASSGSVDLIADVAGYLSPSSTGAFVPIVPFRAADGRTSGYDLTPGSTGWYTLAEEPADSSESLFPTAATMVANITVTNVTAGGYVTAYPENTTRPAVSNLNFGTGQTVACLGLLATSGAYQTIDIYNGSNGYGDAILDVSGYFANS